MTHSQTVLKLFSTKITAKIFVCEKKKIMFDVIEKKSCFGILSSSRVSVLHIVTEHFIMPVDSECKTYRTNKCMFVWVFLSTNLVFTLHWQILIQLGQLKNRRFTYSNCLEVLGKRTRRKSDKKRLNFLNLQETISHTKMYAY